MTIGAGAAHMAGPGPAGYITGPAGYIAGPAGYIAGPAGYIAGPQAGGGPWWWCW